MEWYSMDFFANSFYIIFRIRMFDRKRWCRISIILEMENKKILMISKFIIYDGN